MDEPLAHGTHMRVLEENYPMNTNMTGFWWFSEMFASLFFWAKVASSLEGLKVVEEYVFFINPLMLAAAKSSLNIFVKTLRQKHN